MSKTASGLSLSQLKSSAPVSHGSPATAWEERGRRIWVAVNRSAWELGDWWNNGEPYGDRVQIAERIGFPHQTCRNAASVATAFEVSRRRDTLSWGHHAEVGGLDDSQQEAWLDKAEAGDGPDQPWSVMRLRAELKALPAASTPGLPVGTYSTLIIDPPWPIEKISREVRPRQKAMDYPTMGVDQLAELELPAASDAHLYLWTTHKHLPDALMLIDAWGFTYQCVLTWVKNVGITPFSWMYSTEHVIFARRGGLELAQLGRRLDFTAKVREHSRKPDEFYDLVRDVSPEPRLDMFGRGSHEGFDVWGNEPGKFANEG